MVRPFATHLAVAAASPLYVSAFPLTHKQLEIIGNYALRGPHVHFVFDARLHISIPFFAIIDFVKRWRSRFQGFLFVCIIILFNCYSFQRTQKSMTCRVRVVSLPLSAEQNTVNMVAYTLEKNHFIHLRMVRFCL